MILVTVRGRLDHINNGHRCSRGELENNSRKTRGLTKSSHSQSINKGQITLSQGMEKNRDVVAVDDDAVRTSVSQNQVTATLCTKQPFLRTQYIYIALSTYQSGKKGGGRGNEQSQ